MKIFVPVRGQWMHTIDAMTLLLSHRLRLLSAMRILCFSCTIDADCIKYSTQAPFNAYTLFLLNHRCALHQRWHKRPTIRGSGLPYPKNMCGQELVSTELWQIRPKHSNKPMMNPWLMIAIKFMLLPLNMNSLKCFSFGPVRFAEKTSRNTVPTDLLWEKKTVLAEKKTS